MNVHRATVRDVARHAAVSSGTVSRVFNNHANIDVALRQRVLRAAAELGYAHRPTRGTGTGAGVQVREIGFVLSLPHLPPGGDPMSPFWARILQGAEREATARGARIAYMHAREPGGGFLRPGLDAVLLVGATPLASVRAAMEAGLPACLVDSAAPELGVDAILSDNYWGGWLAAAHLLDNGHRRVAFIGGPLEEGRRRVNGIYTLEWRARGFETALARAGAELPDALFESCDLTPQGGYEACRRLLERGRPFSAVFCGNDHTAMGALRALREAGLHVPGRVSVVGFDDDLAAHAAPRLTTIRVDKEEMGAAGVRRLIGRATEPGAPATTVTLAVDLVGRDSVAMRGEEVSARN